MDCCIGNNLILLLLFFYKFGNLEKRNLKVIFVLHEGFSEVESKATVLSEANRKVKTKGPTADNTREKAANLRPRKPQQKKGKSLFSLINNSS